MWQDNIVDSRSKLCNANKQGKVLKFMKFLAPLRCTTQSSQAADNALQYSILSRCFEFLQLLSHRHEMFFHDRFINLCVFAPRKRYPRQPSNNLSRQKPFFFVIRRALFL